MPYSTTRRLRILVADDEPSTPAIFQKILPALGHEIVGVAVTGRDLVDKCQQCVPDLVITDVMMPDMDGIAAAGEIYRNSAVPVILVSAHYDAEFIARAKDDHVMAYLIKPIGQTQLEPTIAIAMRRFQEFEALRKDTVDLRQALADRKVIEQAKGILMSNAHLDEQSAFRRLQKVASEKNLKLIDIAHMIVTASGALRPPGRASSSDSGEKTQAKNGANSALIRESRIIPHGIASGSEAKPANRDSRREPR